MSGNKNLRPIVINTKSAHAAGSEYVWNKLQNAEVFIADIDTQAVNEASEDLSKLVSGIPTPLARATMFKYAINYGGNDTEQATGLLKFYKSLHDEWKGLVACIALDNLPISVEKIPLAYSDGRSAESTRDLFELKGALGTMLFENRKLWSDQTEQHDRTRTATPFINVIRYNGTVVGGTSPESLLFTAPVYVIGAAKAFYNTTTKKFTDPLKGTLSLEDLEKLYVYVGHIRSALHEFDNLFPGRVANVHIASFLGRWIADMERYARTRGFEIDKNAIVPNVKLFTPPFDTLFNFQTTLFGYGGIISPDRDGFPKLPDGRSPMPVEVELSELLLDPAAATVAEVTFTNTADAASAPVDLLWARAGDEDRYYTIPLSEKGLAIFQDSLSAMLSAQATDVGGRSRLSAAYDKATKTLKVTLDVAVGDHRTSVTRAYRDPIRIEGHKVVVWPNFVSTIWNKYYLYSELPHNAPDFQAFPLRANKEDFRLLTQLDGNKLRFSKISAIDDAADKSAQILVSYDFHTLGDADLKYEIYESTDPFKGIELQYRGKPSGYVLFKALGESALRDYRNIKRNPNPVRVGFDFGSNNTCISFAADGAEPALINFENRRRCLIGVDLPQNTTNRAAASPSEVFFFQNQPTQSNQIKSMIMMHEERRLKLGTNPAIALKSVVKGGFPVFERNVPVEDSTESTYEIRFGAEKSRIKYNMKWSNDARENAYKEAFLKALWLKTYAELLDLEKWPESLVWAYPSAMNEMTLMAYSTLWQEVGRLYPLTPVTSRDSGSHRPAPAKVAERNAGNAFDALTEAASVCKHALLGARLAVGDDGLLIGLDVGGSTTDILCVVHKRSVDESGRKDFNDTLVKESSIRFAAGRLAEATGKSTKFEDALKSYCEMRELHIHGVTVAPVRLNAKTAAYYFNVVIDHLATDEELRGFYRHLSVDCPELFSVNSFITGLVMFYAGQLAHKIRLAQSENIANGEKDYLTAFRQVKIGCFGKGGRMFDWLRAVNEAAAMTYYRDCFNAGYGPQVRDDVTGFTITRSESAVVKAEVSFGLARVNRIHVEHEQINELVGEDGFAYNGVPVDSSTPIEPKFLEHFGTQFARPKDFQRFGEFVGLFFAFAEKRFGLNPMAIQNELNSMGLQAYVNNIPEYQLALTAKRANPDRPFEFAAPIIILEGMCFLDTILMPKLFPR